jgi:DNA polymerase-3 subunit beta
MLRNLLEKTSFAMAHQDVRYYLNGLFLSFSAGRLVAVATDGHRLAKVEDDLETDFEEGSGVILPRKTVLELNRLLQSHHEKVRVDLSERMIRAFIGESVITSKLVDGRYPDYQRVIPLLADKVALVAKDKLRQSLMRTSILSNDKYRGVRLTFDQNEIRLQAHNPEQEEAEDEVEAEYEDEEVSIGFNVGYLLDILGILDGEEVEIRFSDSDSSALIRNSGVENQAFVVMPMRL